MCTPSEGNAPASERMDRDTWAYWKGLRIPWSNWSLAEARRTRLSSQSIVPSMLARTGVTNVRRSCSGAAVRTVVFLVFLLDRVNNQQVMTTVMKSTILALEPPTRQPWNPVEWFRTCLLVSRFWVRFPSVVGGGRPKYCNSIDPGSGPKY